MKGKGRSILLCLDLEIGSEELAIYAAGYGKESGQSLHVLHIIPESSSEDEKTAFQRLKSMIDKRLEGIYIENLAIIRGNVEDSIIEYVREHEIGIIILGHRHKAKRERVYVGSTVRSVISLAPGPVLVVPIDREDKGHEQ